MNAIADAMNSTLQPLIVKVTAVINAFTQWIEANQGLVTAFAVTVAGAAGLAVVLIAIGVAAKGAAAGITVVQTAIKGFTFLQGVAIAQGTALKTSFTLLTQSFANYRNTAIPAMVGTEKFCAALGLASTSANRARASIILMSNAEATAVVKELQEPDPEPLTEYNEFEKTLDDTIGLCRVSLEQYNRIVENPDANWAMRLFRFEPRERF